MTKKTKSEIKSIDVLVHSSTPYDEVSSIYQDINTRLKQITEEGIISELIKQTIMDMSKKVLKQICIQYSNV